MTEATQAIIAAAHRTFINTGVLMNSKVKLENGKLVGRIQDIVVLIARAAVKKNADSFRAYEFGIPEDVEKADAEYADFLNDLKDFQYEVNGACTVCRVG